MFVLPPQGGVGISEVGFSVVPFDFLQNLVGTAFLLVFDVEHGIHEVLALQKTKAILPAEPGKDCAVVERGLGVEIGLGGPPGLHAVLEFAPEGVEVVACALGAEGGKILDFEMAGLLQIVVVGHDVGILLSERRRSEGGERKRKQAK